MGDVKMIKRILPGYFFTLECIYLYFLLYLFYTRIGEIPSILSFIVIIVVGYLILHIALIRNEVSGVFPFLGAIICGGISLALGFTPMSTLLLTVFLFFRIRAFIKDSSMWTEERPILAMLFYISSFLVFYIGWVFHYPYMDWLFGIVIIFTLLLSVGRFLQQLEGAKASKNIGGISSIIGIAIIMTGVITLLLPIVKWAIMNIFKGFILIVTFLLSPLFYLVQSLIFTPKPLDKWVDDPFAQGELSKERKEVTNQFLLENVPLWFWITLFSIIILVIWYILRKRNIKKDVQVETETIMLKHTPTTATLGRKGRFFKEPAPQEYIRKLLFQFQIYADKHHLGRYHHETMREWFVRVGFKQNEELFLAYDNVRYGKEDLQKKDAIHLEEVIKDIKRDIQERKK